MVETKHRKAMSLWMLMGLFAQARQWLFSSMGGIMYPDRRIGMEHKKFWKP
jgi:hypothetical protein